jgi:hypothetical protein
MDLLEVLDLTEAVFFLFDAVLEETVTAPIINVSHHRQPSRRPRRLSY